MTTIYEQELATWIAGRQKAAKLKRKESVVVFLGVRSDVIEAQAAGFALKTIWDHMRETGRLQFRYETFLKYVRRYITQAATAASTSAPSGQLRNDAARVRAASSSTSLKHAEGDADDLHLAPASHKEGRL